jgi:hypothetical protein
MALRRSRTGDLLASPDPATRLDALRTLKPAAIDRLRREAPPWPPLSPASVASWALLVTTKPPQWRDPLLAFPEEPLAAGEPHPGWFYPDPIGFWTEVRRWVTTLVRSRVPGWSGSDALAVSGVVHLGDEPGRLAAARAWCRPRVVLLLDEPAAHATDLRPERVALHHVPDPHRDGQVYQGWWGVLADGTVVGKSPQHPSTHRFYRSEDMDRFLAACPAD